MMCAIKPIGFHCTCKTHTCTPITNNTYTCSHIFNCYGKIRVTVQEEKYIWINEA